MRRGGGRFSPGAAPNQLCHAKVDDSDTAVFAEYQLRWSHLGMGKPALVPYIKRSAGFEADHERL